MDGSGCDAGESSSGRISETGKRFRVVLHVDGRRLELKEFIHDMVGGSVAGLVEALRGVDHPRSIKLEIDRR